MVLRGRRPLLPFLAALTQCGPPPATVIKRRLCNGGVGVCYRGIKIRTPPFKVQIGQFFPVLLFLPNFSAIQNLGFLFLPKFLQNLDVLVNHFWTIFWPFSLVKHLKTPKFFARCARNFPGEFLFLPILNHIFSGSFIFARI